MWLVRHLLFAIACLGLHINLGIANERSSNQSNNHSNVWIVTSNGVQSISDDGEVLATYYNAHLGNPTSLDCSDPFRIMLFYQQHQQVIIISNNGIAIGKPVNLIDLGVGEISLACRSARGGMWLYHREGHELLRINPQLTRVDQKIALAQTQSNQQPIKMIERNGIIYIGIASQRIERIDSYGTTLEPIELMYNEWFWVDDKYLWTLNENHIEQRQLTQLKSEPKLFHCPHSISPLVINGKPMRYENKKLLRCEKLDY